MKFILSLVLVGLLFLQTLWSNDEYSRKTCFAYRVKSESPKIDGRLDDAAWKSVPYQDSFVQINPVENIPPTEKTNFKVVYDDRNIYFAIMAYDSEPDKIEALLSRRDDVDNSDFIGIGLDSYFDRRTAFVFGVNAAGVKYDAIISEDGNNQDESWDPVWEVKTMVTDSGWTAEMRIPFNQIRFADKQSHTWGFQVYRKIYRKQEEDMWQYISKDAAGVVSYFGDLKGLEGIKMPLRMELLPYSLSSMHTFQAEKGNPFTDGRDFRFDFGLDGKVGITGDLTMDFTILPDFGQVEADPSEVNLSAFETFFEEKRPFFIEGKNIFEFPLAIGDGDMAQEKIFYSRRIGRKAHYYPDEEDGFPNDYVNMPDQTRILGAAKISGKTSGGWSVGILDAVTNSERADIEYQGKKRKVTVEPLTNYLVSRLQKDFDQGNTSLGGIVTATNRDIRDDHLKFLNRSAYTGGIDFRHQWDDKTYFFNFKLFGSYLKGDPEAIELVQKSSARYFQRPDADYVKLDTTRTYLTGNGGTINIGRIGNGRWRFATGGIWRSPGLELNDIGFLRRADQIMNYVWIGYRINNPVGIFRRVNINFNEWQGWNYGGDRLFNGGNINGGVQFTNLWGVYIGVNREQDGYSPHLLRGGPLARNTGGWNFWMNVYSDESKNTQIGFSLRNHINDDKISKSFRLRLKLFQKVNTQLNFRLSPFYSYNRDNLQYITTEEFNGQDRYIFGRIVQNTFGFVFRLNYSPTPQLSIQYYGQPFISSGKYSHFKHITRPRAKGDDRYEEYSAQQISYDPDDESYRIDENTDGNADYSFGFPDFNFKEFRSNMVVRWEYKPGSILFLVWAQNRTGFDETGDFEFGANFRQLFNVQPDNVFLVKLNYWFSI